MPKGSGAVQRSPLDVRKMAKSTDIAITTTAVASASQSANKRRILAPLDETVSFGMIFRQRNAQFAERSFDRVHHHVRSADVILVVGEGRRQIARKHRSVYEALLARPTGRRPFQHMHKRQTQSLFERIQLFAKRDRVPVFV